MLRFDKYLRTLGFAFIVLGILLFIIGLIAGSIVTYPPCPATGCPPPVPSVPPYWWWLPGALVSYGIVLVIIGIILLIVVRGMKPNPKPAMAVADDASEQRC